MSTPTSCATLHAEGPVSVVTLNRPERLNAIGGALLPDLHRALVAAHDDPATRVIVLTGAGRAFCAGADMSAAAGSFDATRRWRTLAARSRGSRATSCSAPSW